MQSNMDWIQMYIVKEKVWFKRKSHKDNKKIMIRLAQHQSEQMTYPPVIHPFIKYDVATPAAHAKQTWHVHYARFLDNEIGTLKGHLRDT